MASTDSGYECLPGCYGWAVTGRIRALLLLGLSLVVTLLGLIFRRSGEGLRRFRAQYEPERLPARRPGDLDLLLGLGRCIGCGLCDRGESERVAASRGAYPGVMPLVLNSMRTSSDFAAAAHGFAFVSAEVLHDKQPECPSGVPLEALCEFVARKAQELGGPLPIPNRAPPPPSLRP